MSDIENEDRNPSPPRELLEAGEDVTNADKIGDTLFSKHWVFTTLMKLIKDVEDHVADNNKDDEAAFEVDEALQNELCELWDMSGNPDVANFLQEFNAVDILTAVIRKSRAPRATEISVGILGNMACKEEICCTMSNESFIDLVLLLLENPDAPTLVETTRLIFACVSSPDHISRQWIERIVRSDAAFKSILFIMNSSTNCDLLCNTGELVDKLMDISDQICQKWATEDLVLAVQEALSQTGLHVGALLDTYLHVYQLASTSETGVKALVAHGDLVFASLSTFLQNVCADDEIGGVDREGSLAAAVSVVNVLVTSPDGGYSLLNKDDDLIRCLLKILEALYPRFRTERQSSRESRRSLESPPPATDTAPAPAPNNNNESSVVVTDSEFVKPQHQQQQQQHHHHQQQQQQHQQQQQQQQHQQQQQQHHQQQNEEEEEEKEVQQAQPNSSERDTVKNGKESNNRNLSSAFDSRTLSLADNCASSDHVTEEVAPGHVTEEVTPGHVTSTFLFGLIKNLLVDIIQLISHADKNSTKNVPVVLTYMNEYCPRRRLHALLNCLHSDAESDSESHHHHHHHHHHRQIDKPIYSLLDMAKSYQLNRLSEVVDDFNARKRGRVHSGAS